MVKNKKSYKSLREVIGDLRERNLRYWVLIPGGIAVVLSFAYMISTWDKDFNPRGVGAVMTCITALGFIIGRVVASVVTKMSYGRDLKVLLANSKNIQYISDEAEFLEKIEQALSGRVLYRGSMIVVTNEFVITRGSTTTKMNPVVVPRESIRDIAMTEKSMFGGKHHVMEMHLGGGEMIACALDPVKSNYMTQKMKDVGLLPEARVITPLMNCINKV